MNSFLTEEIGNGIFWITTLTFWHSPDKFSDLPDKIGISYGIRLYGFYMEACLDTWNM